MQNIYYFSGFIDLSSDMFYPYIFPLMFFIVICWDYLAIWFQRNILHNITNAKLHWNVSKYTNTTSEVHFKVQSPTKLISHASNVLPSTRNPKHVHAGNCVPLLRIRLCWLQHSIPKDLYNKIYTLINLSFLTPISKCAPNHPK